MHEGIHITSGLHRAKAWSCLPADCVYFSCVQAMSKPMLIENFKSVVLNSITASTVRSENIRINSGK